MIYEIYKQFQGKAGKRHLKKKFELGLAHNLGGPPQVYSVAILGKTSHQLILMNTPLLSDKYIDTTRALGGRSA